ncbi:MAG: hypothetical protein HEEMFOPI_00584 [Holosporales bacterium]
MKMIPLEGEYHIKSIIQKNKPAIRIFVISFACLFFTLILNILTEGLLFPIFFLIFLYNLVQQQYHATDWIMFLNGLLYDVFSNASFLMHTVLFLILYMGLTHLQKFIFQKNFLKNWLNFSLLCLVSILIQFIFYMIGYDHLFLNALSYYFISTFLVMIFFPLLVTKLYI